MNTLILRRHWRAFAGIAEMTPKFFLAYRAWVWLAFFSQGLSMTIFLFFWRAVYENTDQIGGLNLDQTLTYVLLAQVISLSVWTNVVSNMGHMVREGQIGVEFLRPIDFQWAQYLGGISQLAISLLLNLPLLGLALLYGAQLPTDVRVWIAFLVSLFLGYTVIFLFDWCIACLVFYTTEVWGLMVFLTGVSAFFSGVLIPLVMMPTWLQTIAAALPFSQVVFVPVGLLSGTIPLTEAPARWLTQLIWVIGLAIVSRICFQIASRKVTVQGG
ncbi:MAG: ABC-2 family transporter protein [Anaerolineae bacterium]|jgi:ABC-2 type transport system permease protein|nr:ABC-2 family transporter protein [Anaerolineae bacterium]